MKFKTKELLLGVLLGTGFHLLESLREHLPDYGDDIKTRVRDTSACVCGDLSFLEASQILALSLSLHSVQV